MQQVLRLEREAVRVAGDRPARRAFHSLASSNNAQALAARRALGRSYLARHAAEEPGDLISPTAGHGLADISSEPVFADVLEMYERLSVEKAGAVLPSKGSLDYLALGPDFAADSAAVRLALSPAILAPVIRYLGCLPILFAMGVNRAQSQTFLPHTSHAFHLDPEDVTQVKVFVSLTDIEADRAFHALPADLSDDVVEATGYATGRLSDAAVEAIVGRERLFSGAGPRGTALFCDTARCLHYGGRPGRNVRDVLDIMYVLPTSTWFPVGPDDGERRVLLTQLTPRSGDREWNALIGADLVQRGSA